MLVACLVDELPRFRAEALRLLQSLRWFGGELAKARALVGVIGDVDRPFAHACALLGAEVRQVPQLPFAVPNPTANRLQLFAPAWEQGRDFLLLLDCDVLIVRDPLPLLRDDVFQAKIAPLPTVTMPALRRAFAHFGVPLPEPAYAHRFSGEPTIAYCNGGMLATPRRLLRQLEPWWRYYNAQLPRHAALVRPCEKHIHQAALALALAASEVPFRAVGDELNYQLNQDWLPDPPGFRDLDPAIIHYHDRVGADGFLRRCPYPRAQARIDAFHERLRGEGAPSAPPVRRATPARLHPRTAGRARVVVLGMHRSGTSALASLLDAMGVSAGDSHDLHDADLHNPRGYWEDREVHALDEEALAALGGGWDDPLSLDLEALPRARRSELAARARAIVRRLDERGPWTVKDPRMCLLFPLWREALGSPACVLTFRHPLAVARSLAARDGLPLAVGMALWEVYSLAALAASQGLPRLLVGFAQLRADPAAASRRLRDWLVATDAALGGVVHALGERDARQVIDAAPSPDEDRQGEGDLLTPEQRALLAALESGEALAVDPPPLSSSARAALADYQAMKQRRSAAVEELEEAWQRHARRAHEAAQLRQVLAATGVERGELAERLAVAEGAAAAAQAAALEADARMAAFHAAAGAHAAAVEAEAAKAHAAAVAADRVAAAARAELAERDALLAAVFASRRWRWGSALTAPLRWLARRRAPTATARWQAMRGR